MFRSLKTLAAAYKTLRQLGQESKRYGSKLSASHSWHKLYVGKTVWLVFLSYLK